MNKNMTSWSSICCVLVKVEVWDGARRMSESVKAPLGARNHAVATTGHTFWTSSLRDLRQNPILKIYNNGWHVDFLSGRLIDCDACQVSQIEPFIIFVFTLLSLIPTSTISPSDDSEAHCMCLLGSKPHYKKKMSVFCTFQAARLLCDADLPLRDDGFPLRVPDVGRDERQAGPLLVLRARVV